MCAMSVDSGRDIGESEPGSSRKPQQGHGTMLMKTGPESVQIETWFWGSRT